MHLLEWARTRLLLVVAAYWVFVLVGGLIMARMRARHQLPSHVERNLVEYEGSLHLGRVALVLLGPPMLLVFLRFIIGG